MYRRCQMISYLKDKWDEFEDLLSIAEIFKPDYKEF